MQINFNFSAVFVAGIASMALGALWYGPLFGKYWMAWSGFSPEKLYAQKAKGMGARYAINFVAAFIMAFVLNQMVKVWDALYLGDVNWVRIFLVAFLPWIGFIAPVLIGVVLWEEKPWKLYILNVVYQLVALFAMALILVFWQ